ncbi:PspA/IM30 family protein [Pseudomonas aeruginosa]
MRKVGEPGRKAATSASLRQQVDLVKATESDAGRRRWPLPKRYGNSKSKLQTAVDSLERIKQRQAERAAIAWMAAPRPTGAAAPDDALDAKLRAAGIKASGNLAWIWRAGAPEGKRARPG